MAPIKHGSEKGTIECREEHFTQNAHFDFFSLRNSIIQMNKFLSYFITGAYDDDPRPKVTEEGNDINSTERWHRVSD